MRSLFQSRALPWYFLFCYLLDLALYHGYTSYIQTSTLRDSGYVLLVTLTYPLIFLLPLIFFATLFKIICTIVPGARKLDTAFTLLMVLFSSMLTNILYTDIHLYDLYGFHINAFVLNLLITPGGIDSLGGGWQTYVSTIATVIAIVIFQLVIFKAATIMQVRMVLSRRLLIPLFSIFVLCTIGERLIYGYSDVKQYAPVLRASSAFPLYNHVKFRGLAKKLGIDPVHRNDIKVRESNGKLHYPLNKLIDEPPTEPLNIIWLVSESMRWDMLSEEIMPKTFAASKTGMRFTQHYSGGNGTRQGLFALFYGLYGSYWDAFLAARQPPALLGLLQARDYQLDMFTSADFTYPEFDQTMFALIPQSHLHQIEKGISAWRRDELNTGKIVQLLKTRTGEQPFMIFMFYESTHARYHFPENAVIRKPYLGDLNYATMSRKSLAPRISELKNRYVNAGHHIDNQLGKIYRALSEQDLWKNTIVMVTGDHGEEFMEHGFWGHNSGFSDEQIKIPMVLWIPNQPAQVVNHMTSHMDIIPTILPILGVKNPVSDYSLGSNILDPHTSVIVSDWAGVAYIGEQYKFTLPFKSSIDTSNELFTADDQPSDDIVGFLSTHRGKLDSILVNAKRFTTD